LGLTASQKTHNIQIQYSQQTKNYHNNVVKQHQQSFDFSKLSYYSAIFTTDNIGPLC